MHDEIGAVRLEAATEVGDGMDEEGGAIGAGLVKVRCRLAVVGGVEAVDAKDEEGVVVGDSEALIVEEAEVIAEPDEGGNVGKVARERGAWRELAEMVDLKEKEWWWREKGL